MQNILVFNRPFTSKFTSYYKESDYSVYFISDFKHMDDVGLMKRAYRKLNSKQHEDVVLGFDYDNYIVRDRYLKNLEFSLAVSLINCVSSSIDDVLNERNYKAYIGLCVDNYVAHLIVNKCIVRGIRATSPIQSFLKGYTRLNNFGECYKARNILREEVDPCLQSLTAKEFKPIWLNKPRSLQALTKMFYKERVKKLIFSALKVLLKDPYSFHYNVIYPLPGAVSVKSYENINSRMYFEQDRDIINKAISSSGKVVYFALQFTPETSLNYYIKDYRFANYFDLIREVMNSVDEQTLIIFKEHPDMFGYRDVEFYQFIKSFKNTLLIDISFSTSEVLNWIDTIIVTGNASTAVEATLKGKTVISLGGAAFFEHNPEQIHQVWSIEDIVNINTYINSKITLNNEQKKGLIARILENSIPYEYDFVRSKSKNYIRDKDCALGILNYIIDPGNPYKSQTL